MATPLKFKKSYTFKAPLGVRFGIIFHGLGKKRLLKVGHSSKRKPNPLKKLRSPMGISVKNFGHRGVTLPIKALWGPLF